MSQLELSNDILVALQSFSNDYEKSKASTGSVWRPPSGEWNSRVKSVDVTVKDQYIQLKDGQKFPALKVAVGYETLEPFPPDSPKPGSNEWPGRIFLFPIGGLDVIPGDPEKGKKAAIRIDMQRFKGLMEAMIGNEATGKPEIDVPNVARKLANRTILALRVRCQYDTATDGSGTKYFKEFGVKNLSR